MRADYVQANHDAFVTVQVQEELTVVLNNVLQVFDVARRGTLLALNPFRVLQPLLESPEVYVQLRPVSSRTQWTRQSTLIAVELIYYLLA